MRAASTVLVAAVLPVACAAAAPAPLGHAGRWITDAQGRVVIVHGFNLVGAYTSSLHDPQDAFGFDDDDAAFLAAEGFNAMRVGIVYQDVEPRPGVYNDAYVQKIADLVEMLARHGIYSLLDYHQGDYGPLTHGYGLPDWATVTDGLPNPDLGFGGNYLANPALERAFDNLYADAPGPGGVGIADRLAAGYARVARRFAAQPYVLGYDLFNEPWPGSQYPSCTGPAGCPVFDRQSLTPFERKLITGVRRNDGAHLVFYEPNIDFNYGAETNLGTMGDPRAAFSFHDYCLGAGGGGAFPEPPPGTNQAGCAVEEQTVLNNALARGAGSGDALLLSEWGATDDINTYRRMADEADADMLPWEDWTFYNCCGAVGASQGIIIDPSRPPTPQNLHEDRLDALDRPYPRAIAGTPSGWHWDAARRTFTLDYSSRPAGSALARAARTEVWIGSRHYPNGYSVQVKGARVTSPADADLLELAANAGARSVHVVVVPAPAP